MLGVEVYAVMRRESPKQKKAVLVMTMRLRPAPLMFCARRIVNCVISPALSLQTGDNVETFEEGGIPGGGGVCR